MFHLDSHVLMWYDLEDLLAEMEYIIHNYVFISA